MGSRGAFNDVDKGDFSFVDNGQIYMSLGTDPKTGVKYLVQNEGSVKIPDYSHSSDRIYAVVQDGEVKQIGIYHNHIKIISIDLKHWHNGIKPHVHTDLFHIMDARKPNGKEQLLIEAVEKGLQRFK